MRIIQDIGNLVHGEIMLGVGSKLHGMFIGIPSGYPVASNDRFDEIGVDMPGIRGFSGDIDHFLKELNDVILVGEVLKLILQVFSFPTKLVMVLMKTDLPLLPPPTRKKIAGEGMDLWKAYPTAS